MGKFSSLEGRNIPPFLPINWADWEADEHVEQMNETMQGVYFLIIKELWKYDQFEFDYKVVSSRIRAKDWRNVRTFLEKWGHLFRCVECGGTPTPRWEHVGVTHPPCRYCVGVTHCPCSPHAPPAYHPKLRNYQNNAISGVGLGTIEANGKQGKSKQANNAEGVPPPLAPKPDASPVTGEKTKTTPAPDAPSALADIREWNEDRCGVPAERLRNCIVYQLDHAKDAYIRNSGITPASMEHANFIKLLTDCTPLGWSPNAATKKVHPPSRYQAKEEF